MEDYERYVKELEKQLQPIKDAIAQIMHPETGFYPQVRDIKNGMTRAHERIDEITDRMKAVQHVIYGNGDPGIVDQVRSLVTHKESVVKTLLWVAGAIGTPLVGGIVFLIFFK